ncbi:SNF2-related protein [Oceanithermus sp.]|uniref:SNF2-related protein n=1 Tax=Oceanithermus sp. TaxID=2268145 RepID=UPI00257FD74F|nr:SNF2-related protein [Oceanithermus sp.]
MTLREIYDLIKAQAQALFNLPPVPSRSARRTRRSAGTRRRKAPPPDQPALFDEQGRQPEQPSLFDRRRDKAHLKPVKKVVHEKSGKVHTQTYWEKEDGEAEAAQKPKPQAAAPKPEAEAKPTETEAKPEERPAPDDWEATLRRDPEAALDELEREVERVFDSNAAPKWERKKLRPRKLPRGNDPLSRLQRMLVKLQAAMKDLYAASSFAYDAGGRVDHGSENLIKTAGALAKKVEAAARLASRGELEPPKPAEPEKDEGPAVAPADRQKSADAKAVAEFLERAGLREHVLREGDEDGDYHLRIPNPPFLPLVIERHPGRDGAPRLYLTHYRHADPDDPMSDIYLDGELVYKVAPDGALELEETATHDPIRGYELRGRDPQFARVFAQNLTDHFYHEVPRERWEGKNAPQVEPSVPDTAGPAPAELPADPSDQHLREGAEKTVVFADGAHTYRLKGGRWHRVDEEPESAPSAPRQATEPEPQTAPEPEPEAKPTAPEAEAGAAEPQAEPEPEPEAKPTETEPQPEAEPTAEEPAQAEAEGRGLNYARPLREILKRIPRFGFALLPKATVAQRTKANARAVELLGRLENEKREPTEEERQVLAAYTGEGGLTGDLNAHYTPAPLAAAMWALLHRVAGQPKTALEPSMGNGVFLHTAPDGTRVTGVELSEVSGRIGKLLHEPRGHKVYPGLSFEEYNQGEGQEHTYDAVIANPPYGIRGSLIGKGKPWLAKAEQYFIDASLDRLKDGGVGVHLINPGPVENPSTRDFRRRLLARAEVLGAYQLPSSVFKESNSGVPPVVLVVRKRPDDEGMTLLRLVQRHGEEALEKAGVLTDAARDFLDGKLHLRDDHLFGKWSGETTYHGYKKIEGELEPGLLERLAQAPTDEQPADMAALERHYGDEYASARDWATSAASNLERGRVEEGTVSEDGRLVFRNGRWHTIQGEDPRLAAAVSIADELREYVHVLNNGSPADAEARRKAVVESLKRYLEEYGNPHQHLTGELKRRHSLAHLLSAVTPKGDVAEHLLNPVTGERGEGVDYTDPYAVAAHLARQRRLTPTRLASVLAGKGWGTTQAMEWLAENGYAMDESGRWIPDDEFYVGDVYERSEALERAAEAPGLSNTEREILRAQARKFREKLPRKPLEEVEITARDHYVRPEVVRDFIGEVVDPGGQYNVRRTDTGIFIVEHAEGYKLPDHVKEFVKYLNFDTPVRRLTAEQTKTMTRAELDALKAQYREEARKQEQEWADQFKAWAASSDYREELEEGYNRTYNSYIPPKYSDEPLDIPDWKGPPLHDFQTEAVRHALDTGNSIMALDVGLGKTYAGLALAQLLEHEGRAKRVMHIMPKSLMGNWRNSYAELGSGRWYITGEFAVPEGTDEQTAADAQKVYDLLKERDLINLNDAEKASGLEPERFRAALRALSRADVARGVPGDHVMVIGETFDPKKKVWREDKMKDVATKLARLAADPSITRVLITRDKFGAIPVRPETLERYVKDDVVRAREFEEAQHDKRKKRSERDWVGKMQQAMEKATAKLFGDQVRAVHWEDLGVDALISDEHHAYKNLHAAPRVFGESPKFLGAGSESQRALDMLIKARHVRDHNDGSGIYALTATPTKNSPLEVYNMLRYVTDAVDRIAPTPEAFISRYTDIGNALVATPGGVEVRTAVLGFKNLGELRGLMNRYIFRRTAQEVGLKIPEREDHEHIFEMHPEQHTEYRALAAAAQHAAANREAEGDEHFFSYLARMRFLTLDPAVYDPERLGHLPNPRFQKAGEIAKQALSEGGKVVMFMDLGQSSMDENPAEDMGEDALREYAKRNKLPHEGMTTAKLRKLVAKHLEESRTNAYARLKQHLVEAGVPEDQIAVVTSKTAKSSAARADIEAAYKAGKIRVVIGSTGVIGEGFNLQTGTTDMVHLDVPWDPGTYWQRLGRAVRQGNTQEKVRNHVLLARGSVDAMTYGTMLGKKGWTDILWNSTEERARNADAMDPENDPYTQMLMQTADNPDDVRAILEKQKKKRLEEAKAAAWQATVQKLQQASILHHSVQKQRGLVAQAQANLEKAHAEGSPEKVAVWNRRLEERSRKLKRLEGEWRARMSDLERNEQVGKDQLDAIREGRPFVIAPSGQVFVEGGHIEQHTKDGGVRHFRILSVSPVTKTMQIAPLVPLQRYGSEPKPSSYKIEDVAELGNIFARPQVDDETLGQELAQRLRHVGVTGLQKVHPDVVRRHHDRIQEALKEWAKQDRGGIGAWVVNREGVPEHRTASYAKPGIPLEEGERLLTNTPEDIELWRKHHGERDLGYDALGALPFYAERVLGKRHWRAIPRPEQAEYLVKASLVELYHKMMGRTR